jgi:hypothetical protein
MMIFSIKPKLRERIETLKAEAETVLNMAGLDDPLMKRLAQDAFDVANELKQRIDDEWAELEKWARKQEPKVEPF